MNRTINSDAGVTSASHSSRDLAQCARASSWFLQALFAALILSVVPCGAMAEDKSSTADAKQEERPATQPDAEKKTDARSFLDQVKDELFKKEANPDAETKVDKMERAVKGMRNAGSKLEEGQSADDTQKIQKQVIKDLEDIINQMENPPPNGGGGGGGGSGGGGGGGGGNGGGSSGQNRNRGGASSLRSRRPQGAGSKSSSSRQNQQQAGKQESSQNSENAQDSSKSLDPTKKSAEEAERRRKLEMDIWGHLPPHLREELLNTYSDRMLPKYEQLVKQFYEALSTQNEKKSR